MVTKNTRNAKFEEKKKSVRRQSRLLSSDYSGNVPTNLSDSISTSQMELEYKRSNASIKPIIDHGKNMTPKSLYTGKAHNKHGAVRLTDLDQAKDQDFRSMTSVFNAPNSAISANSIMGAESGIFGRSLRDSSMRRMSVQNKSIMSLGTPSTLHSVQSLLSSVHSPSNLTPTSSQNTNLSSLQSSSISLLNKTETPKLSEEMLKQNIEYNLTETETEIVFKIIGSAVEENENLEQVKEQNDRYDKILKEAGPGNEKYVGRAMLTFNNALKHKEAETDKIDRIDTGNQVSNSAIWDAFNSQSAEDEFFKEDEPELNLPQAQTEQATSNTSTTTSDSSGSFNLSSTGNLVQRRPKIVDKHDIKIRHDAILKSANLFSKLLLMERVISQNIHQSQLSRYRSLEPLDQNGNKTVDESDMTDFDHGLIRLWSFKDAQLKGFNVNSIAFNRVNPDIVAVGYGHSQRSKGASKSPGLVCVWSMRNLEYPERIFRLPDSVTAVDFSTASPNLLAVGLANGTILIYNITRNADQPIVDSVDNETKHLGVVWSLKWTERERGTEEKKEVLISTSSDGTVVQWTIRKGFESIVLIKVKRTSKKTKKDRSGNSRKTDNAVISQLSPATSFNFHPTDGNTYLVGTEEGLIHRCSCSYNEQTLDSYTGHRGQVYSVQWHPTIPNIFISCSEDWSIRLWHQRRYDEPITSIQCSQKPIRAVQWSPHAPNIAASISAEAIDIWDLSISTLDPVFSLPVASGLFLTSIAFSQTSNSILVGDSEGSVAVYQLKGFKNAPAQDLIDFIQSVVGNKIMY